MSTRTCRGCEQERPLEDFHRSSRAKDGRQSKCKACLKAYQTANREDYVRRQRKWRKKQQHQQRRNVQGGPGTLFPDLKKPL